MMFMGQSDLPCFSGGQPLIGELKDRLFPEGKRSLSYNEAKRHINSLVD